MFDPLTVMSASNLPPELPVILEDVGNLNLSFRRPLLYSFHWLRESVLGSIAGDLGLQVDAGGEVSSQVSVSGNYRREISLDERGWLRVRVLKRQKGDFGFAARIAVSAQAATPLPKEPDALVAAILGIHESQSLGLLELAKQGRAVSLPIENLRQIWGAFVSGPSVDPIRGLAALQSLDGWARKQIEGLFGPIRTEADVSKLLDGLRTLVGLRDSVYDKALGVLEKQYEAELSCRYASASESTALVDCSFAFTPEGLSAYRKTLTGDYSWILTADPSHTEMRQGLLTSGTRSESSVELHLPFLGAKEWSSRLEVLSKMEVVADGDGRLIAYHVEACHRVAKRNTYQSVLALAGGLSVGKNQSNSSFSLSYSDQRRIASRRAAVALSPVLRAYGFGPETGAWLREIGANREGDLDVSLELSVPGALVSAWIDAPGEREGRFLPCYTQMSEAVQRALRLWLPYLYFSDISRYETLGAAFPLVVYQVSKPYRPKSGHDFSYDVLSEESMSAFFRRAERHLPAELRRVQELLMAAGKESTAAFYDPKLCRKVLSAVWRGSRQLNSLLIADAFLVSALVNLGCRGHALRQEAAKNPAAAVRGLTLFAGELVKTFHGKLRRLYGGQDFLALGALLLVEATRALNGGSAAGVSAVLRISQPESAHQAALSQTLVNAAYPSAGK